MEIGRGNDKRKTIVVNIDTGKEIVCESRFEACRITGIARKALNGYMKKGIVFQKRYKFIDLS